MEKMKRAEVSLTRKACRLRDTSCCLGARTLQLRTVRSRYTYQCVLIFCVTVRPDKETSVKIETSRLGALADPARQRLHAVHAHLQLGCRTDADCVQSPVCHAPSAAESLTATPNSPRGLTQQGFGIGWQDRASAVQPPMFDPTWQFRQACEFYAENGFVVVDALSQDEVAEMNNVADLFLRDTAGASFGAGGSGLEGESHGNGQLFYPLLGSADDIDRYSAVDKYITHPKTLPIIAHVLGGLKNVRFQEFNWRGYPEGFGVQQSDGSYKSGAKCMAFHPDANNAERFDRRPYGPPDYLSAFFYLTDVSAETPAFSVVPKSHLSRTLTEVRQTLANEYVEYRIEGKAGLCCIVDSATFHTRLDNTSGDGSGGRRIMHIACKSLAASSRLMRATSGVQIVLSQNYRPFRCQGRVVAT
eukprot:SAG11_NODE_1187_length_5588_cov_6.285662_5_plen_416_part_00